MRLRCGFKYYLDFLTNIETLRYDFELPSPKFIVCCVLKISIGISKKRNIQSNSFLHVSFFLFCYYLVDKVQMPQFLNFIKDK